MQLISLFNRSALLFCFLSLVINVLFLYVTFPGVSHSITQLHGNVGYNVYRYNSLNVNSKLSSFINSLKTQDSYLIDYHVVGSHDFGKPANVFPVNDTVGYGVVLGLLWKITGTLRFLDVQILQVLIFSLLMLFFYQIAFMLFNSTSIAWWSSSALLFFFPLVALNVQAVRDIWAYYGLIVLLYGLLAFLKQGKSIWYLLIGFSLFSLCQFVRSTLFLVVVTVSIFLVAYALFCKSERKKSLLALFFLIITNIIFFWVPFIAYNKNAYNRYFVGPVGQDLLEGLGEFPNKWGYKLDDGWIGDYIGTKYDVVYGTPEFDDKAKEEFLQAFHENPLVYFKNIEKRIPSLFFPALPWIFHQESPYKDCSNWQEKLRLVFSSWKMFFDFLLRHVYIRLYLLFGYIGLFLALKRKQYFAVFLLLAVLFAGYGKLPSHIEYRYLVPFYWVFSLFIGYLVFYIKNFSESS